jgi:hypothetical protein
MTLVEREDEWMKEIIIVKEVKQRLKINCSYGWNFQNYLYMPRNAPELNEWGNFKEKFRTSPENIQELIIKKIHGGIVVWCIQHRSLIIDATKLTKYRRWLPINVCIITLILIKKVFATHHLIQFLDKRKLTKPNINALKKKWMSSDMFWAPRSMGSKYVMRTRGSEEYISKIIQLEEFLSIIIFQNYMGIENWK